MRSVSQAIILASLFGTSFLPGALAGTYENYRDAGEVAFGQNNYGQAEKNFLAALKEAESLNPKDLRLASALKNLAQLYEVRGQFPKAEGYWERELRAREKALGGEHPQVLACVAKVLRFYLAHNQPVKAERLSKLLLAFVGNINKQNQKLDGHMSELAKFFAGHGEYAQVSTKLKQADESMKKVRADDSLELAAAFDSIAALYEGKSKTELAEQFYRQALELRQKTLPPGHLALGFSYENLAKLNMAQGHQSVAQSLFKQSLAVTGQTLDLKRPEVFSRLSNLAHSYESSGQAERAETLYKQALTLLNQNFGGQHRDVGLTSAALADLYLKQKRYSEAEPLLKNALTIAESVNGPQSAVLVPLLDNYAETVERLNKNAQAAKLRSRANSIRGNSTASISATDF